MIDTYCVYYQLSNYDQEKDTRYGFDVASCYQEN